MPTLRPTRAVRRQTPARRRPKHRFTAARKRQADWRLRAAIAAALVVVALVGWASLARSLAPTSNTTLTRFDAIIVLGTPADDDGNPTPRQLARVSEGVREYERGVAPRLILTGGAAANQFAEAQVMERTAEAEGIPATAIIAEPRAMNTIENACFAVRIMKARGWQSAEVVSSDYHLPRAGMIFNHLPIEWRAHAAPPVEPESPVKRAAMTISETLKTARYLIYARWADRCEP